MKKIPVSQPFFFGNEIEYVTESVKSTWVRSGKYLDLFEKKFAKFCDTSYASAASSGTTALHLLLLSLNIKKDDEVIVPDLTYVATANTVTYNGAKPIFVDVERDIWAISPEKIEENITKKTKAIVVVHLYGHPAEMDSINNIAYKYKIPVIEDACQAHGALYKDKKVGSLSKAACFSFSGAKLITTGEGGMITTSDKNLIQRVIEINNDFMSKKRKFYHSDIGYNYRLTNLQAALGLAQLENINKLLDMKIKNAGIYTSLLKDESIIQLPLQKTWAKNVFWLYSVVLKKKRLRNKLMSYLDGKGIETRPFFVPIHRLPMYKQTGNFSNTDYLSENGLSLPSGANLKQSEIEYICSEVKKFIKKNA